MKRIRRITESYDKKEIEERVAKYFDYDINFETQDIFVNLVERALDNYDGNKDDFNECVLSALDEGFIYNDDMWTIAKFYNGNPIDMNWEETSENFYNDLSTIVYDIIEE